MKKQIQIFPSLGVEYSVGWERDDIPNVVHVFAQAAPGTAFQPNNGHGGPHWPCAVCTAHGYTEADFNQQMTALMEDYSDHRPKA